MLARKKPGLKLSIAPKFNLNAVPDVKVVQDKKPSYENLLNAQDSNGSWQPEHLDLILRFVTHEQYQKEYKECISKAVSENPSAHSGMNKICLM